MSYKGIQITSQEDYIFSDTIPYDPEFDIEELKVIQKKLEDFSAGYTSEGITTEEAEKFLDWVTFNARSYAVRNGPESPISSSMTGQCAPTQRINFNLLSRLGLDVRAFNTADCIGEIPINEDDYRRIQNGWSSPAVRHSVSLVSIPIINDDGNTQSYKFLLDPTFRQFCKKENCNYNNFIDQERLNRGYVAPHPGYFMMAENLMQLGVPQETAERTEMLGKCIISKGYFWLNEETAKLYGDTFVRSSERLEFQDMPINLDGNYFIENFENIPMHILPGDKGDEEYTRLPSEIGEKKQGIFSKLINYFKDKFTSKKTLALGAGSSYFQEKEVNAGDEGIRGSVKLSPEQLALYYEKINAGRDNTNIISSNGDNEYYK
jgi:hypothetical protein